MNLTNTIQQFFGKTSLQDVDIEELRLYTKQQPYSAAGWFLLLKKMQDTNDPGFQECYQSTSLYFHNHLWLQWLLQPHNVTEETIVLEKKEEETSIPVSIENETTIGPLLTEAAPVLPGNELEEQVVATEIMEPVTGEQNGIDKAAEEDIAIDHDETEEEMRKRKKADTINEPKPLATKPDRSFIPVIPGMDKGEILDDVLTFEPYHTIDYFASVGVLTEKEGLLNSDKLGSQLKSFTAWLKTLKRLPGADIEEQKDFVQDSAVESMAAHSIKEKETITESMAEVLLMQGKKERALEIYHKLSLLNPAKSHYFAAKIESIKRN